MWHANMGRLLLRTPGPFTFGTCICSCCWDQFCSRTCRYFSRLFYSNISRYFLDYEWYMYNYDRICFSVSASVPRLLCHFYPIMFKDRLSIVPGKCISSVKMQGNHQLSRSQENVICKWASRDFCVLFRRLVFKFGWSVDFDKETIQLQLKRRSFKVNPCFIDQKILQETYSWSFLTYIFQTC